MGYLSKKHSKPTECPTDDNDEQTTGDNLLSHRPSEGVIGLLVGDIHSYTHTEDKEWEDKVSRCATIPRRMAERCIDMCPSTRVIDKDHARDGDTTQNVQREETFFSWCRSENFL